MQATETSSRRNDRKTEVARGTFRRLRTHSRRPATEVHAGSSRVNRTRSIDDVRTIKNYRPLTDVPRLKRHPFSSKARTDTDRISDARNPREEMNEHQLGLFGRIGNRSEG